jgi:hypothetical protein
VPLPDSLLFPAGYSSANGAFTLSLPGPGSYQQGKNAIDEQRQINVIDNLSLTKGSHALKFGSTTVGCRHSAAHMLITNWQYSPA